MVMREGIGKVPVNVLDEPSPDNVPTPQAPVNVYLMALKEESIRRKTADDELRVVIEDTRTALTEDSRTLRSDFQELRQDVTQGLKGSRAILGVIVTIAAGVGPEGFKLLSSAVKSWFGM